MKISRVIGQNVKGMSFDHKLGKVTKISGKNRTGKTAILDTIRLALHGVTENVGKTSVKHLLSGSDPEMKVELETDNGIISRSWKRSASGSLKSTGQQGDEVVNFNPLSYAEATPAARKKMLQGSFRESSTLDLFAASSSGCTTYDELVSKVEEAAAKKKELAAVLKRDEATVTGNLQTSLESDSEDFEELGVELEREEEKLDAATRLLEEDERRLRVVQEIIANYPEEPIGVVQARLEDLREQRDSATKERIRISDKLDTAAKLEDSRRRMETIREQLDGLPHVDGEFDSRTAHKVLVFLDSLDCHQMEQCPCCGSSDFSESFAHNRIERLKHEIAESQKSSKKANLQCRLEALEKSVEELDSALGGDIDIPSLRDRAGALKIAEHVLSCDIKRDERVILQSERADLLIHGHNNHIIPTTAGWKELEQMVVELREQKEDIQNSVKSMRARRDAAVAHGAAESAGKLAKERVKKSREDLKLATAELKKLQAIESDALRELVKPLFTRASKIVSEVLEADVGADGLDLYITNKDGTPVTFPTMSGAERMMVALAIEAAFSQSGVAMMDELGALDPDTAERLTEWARFQDMFENVVLVFPTDTDLKVEIL